MSGWNDLLPKTQLNLSGKKANDGFSVLCIHEAVAGTVACVWIDPTITLNSVWATCSVTVVNGRGGSLDFTLEKGLLLKFGKDIYWTWLLQYTTKGDGIPVLDVAVCNNIVTNAKNVSFYSSSSGMTSLAGHSLSVPETAWSFLCDMDSDALVFHILGWEKDNPGSCECKTIAPEKITVSRIPVLSAATDTGVSVLFEEDSSSQATIDISSDLTISRHGQDVTGTVIYILCVS